MKRYKEPDVIGPTFILISGLLFLSETNANTNLTPVFAQIFIGNTTSIENVHERSMIPIECKKYSSEFKLSVAGSSTKEKQALTDDNLSTYWSNRQLGSEITIDLGSLADLCGIEIAWYEGDSRAYNFTISISSHGEPFTILGSGYSSGNSEYPEFYNLDSEMARYISIVVYGSTVNTYAGVSEVRPYVNAVDLP